MEKIAHFFKTWKDDVIALAENRDTNGSVAEERFKSVALRALGVGLIAAGVATAVLTGVVSLPIAFSSTFLGLITAMAMITLGLITAATFLALAHDAIAMGNKMHDFVETFQPFRGQRVFEDIREIFRRIPAGASLVNARLQAVQYGAPYHVEGTWVVKPLYKFINRLQKSQ